MPSMKGARDSQPDMPRDEPPYMTLARHYENCLEQFGPTHKGVDWPNAEDLSVRFDVMLDVIRAPASRQTSLLDLGCGPGLLLDHLAGTNAGQVPEHIDYQGIDISRPMIEAARARYASAEFSVRDILQQPLPPQSVDYVVMNGVLTEKRSMSFDEMEQFAVGMITAAFSSARKGIAFNVMSTFVDWERDDLFHWSCDRMMQQTRALTPHVTVRADYGLREYTTYLYRDPLPHA